MFHDIPRVKDVIISEYADDIIVYCSGSSFNEVKAKVQDQINKLYELTKTCCLTINPNITKEILFTNKKLDQPTCIFLNNKSIEYVKTFKYLGMVLDAPNFRWKPHIDHIRNSSVSKTSIAHRIKNPLRRTSEHITLHDLKYQHNTYFV